MTLAQHHLSFNSEHRLRAENLSWDIDVWYPLVKEITFKSCFIPIKIKEAFAIKAFNEVSWRHTRESLFDDEVSVLKTLESDIQEVIKEQFCGSAFVRLCGRSPKDGEPLNRDKIWKKYQDQYNMINMPYSDAVKKMIAISKTPLLQVSNGSEAMSLLLTSERVYAEMLDWIRFGEPEQICLREWNDELTMDFEFRVFVSGDAIRAITQYDHYSYFPHLKDMKAGLEVGIKEFWCNQVHPRVRMSQYVVDIGYLSRSESYILIEFSPFYPCTGGALFSWQHDYEILTGVKPFEFRVRESADEVHPQLGELLEETWDNRWRKPFIPYYQYYQDAVPRPTHICNPFFPVFRNPFRVSEVRVEKSHLLFVYGTLKHGFHWNSKYLHERLGAKLISPATTMDNYELVLGESGVPYLLYKSGMLPASPAVLNERFGSSVEEYEEAIRSLDKSLRSNSGAVHCQDTINPMRIPNFQVIGELWRVSSECMLNLDDYEGVTKGYYSRNVIKVRENVSGRIADANVYVLSTLLPGLEEKSCIPEYTLAQCCSGYNAIKHIHVKQVNYFKTPSDWGKFDGNGNAFNGVVAET